MTFTRYDELRRVRQQTVSRVEQYRAGEYPEEFIGRDSYELGCRFRRCLTTGQTLGARTGATLRTSKHGTVTYRTTDGRDVVISQRSGADPDTSTQDHLDFIRDADDFQHELSMQGRRGD